MAMPDALAHRLVQLRQRLEYSLAPVCQIDHERLARLGADQVLVALRAHGRQVNREDGEWVAFAGGKRKPLPCKFKK